MTDRRKRRSARPTDPSEAFPTCSFCGRASGEYRAVVKGPGVYICDVCVAESRRRLAGEHHDE